MGNLWNGLNTFSMLMTKEKQVEVPFSEMATSTYACIVSHQQTQRIYPSTDGGTEEDIFPQAYHHPEFHFHKKNREGGKSVSALTCWNSYPKAVISRQHGRSAK